MITSQRLLELLSRTPALRIAVVGDFFLDKYLVTDPTLSEVSIETGLEARQVVQVRCSPGAAGTVTNNLSALGVGTLEAFGVIGDDGEGYELLKGLEATGVHTDGLIRTATRFTPTYTKPMVREGDCERELERLDIKNRLVLESPVEDELIRRISARLGRGLDAVIVADQVQEADCGSISTRVRDALTVMARAHPEVVFFADSRVRVGLFQPGWIVKPNQHEAAAALGIKNDLSIEQAEEIGKRFSEINQRPAYLTLGERGMLACTPETATLAATLPVTGEIDIVGAGDSAASGIVVGLCAKGDPLEAAILGNLCASVTIRKLGTTGTASPEELLALL